MCGHYTMHHFPQQVEMRFGITEAPATPTERYNIAPTQTVPVVVEGDGARFLDAMQWGLIPSWAKDPGIGNKMINARAETLPGKPSFKVHRSSIRMVVADNHPMIRESFSAVILHQRGMCIVGEASDGQEAIDLYRLYRPDVLLMDIAMPHMDGLQATQAIIKEFPHACVIIYTILDGDETVYQAMLAGARGYLLLETIEAVVAGMTYLPAELAGKLAGRLHLRSLTNREQERAKVLGWHITPFSPLRTRSQPISSRGRK